MPLHCPFCRPRPPPLHAILRRRNETAGALTSTASARLTRNARWSCTPSTRKEPSQESRTTVDRPPLRLSRTEPRPTARTVPPTDKRTLSTVGKTRDDNATLGSENWKHERLARKLDLPPSLPFFILIAGILDRGGKPSQRGPGPSPHLRLRMTSAILDRLLHHAETVTLEGNSFRMKDVIDK